MKTDLRMLDYVHVAKPCPANWDEMEGTDQVRHCSICRLNVYNLSEMDGQAALKLVQKAEGRTCVRFYRREDGTMITRDCPKGLRAFRQRAAKRMVLALSMVLSAVGCGSMGERLKEDFGIAKVAAPKPVAVTVHPGEMSYIPPPKGMTRTTATPVTIAKSKGKKK